MPEAEKEYVLMVTKHFSYFLNNSRGPLQMQILSKASGITSCCLFARETNILVNVVFRSNFGPVLPCAHWPDTDRHLVGAQSKGWLPKILSYSANVKITRGHTWDVIDVANAPTHIVDWVFWTDTGVAEDVLGEMPFITAVQSVHINFHVNSC